MEDIKIFAKNNREQETLIHTIRIYSLDRGIEVGIKKCARHIIKKEKRKTTEGINLHKKESFRTFELIRFGFMAYQPL